MRLDKFLVDCGVGSRTEVKQLLKQKKIAVNGKKETAGKLQIDPAKDQVTFMGENLVHETFVYYLLHKPAGVISATEDDHHQTVLDLLDETARQKEVFPVGRLDIDTHGLLLLTNNGKLAHAMLSPKKHVSKVYRAHVAGIMDEADVARFEAGIALKDFTTLPARLQILEVDETSASSYVEIEIAEGKFHQVKRMFEAVGCRVVYLKRLSMGSLRLDESLAPGAYRRLTEEEISKLQGEGDSGDERGLLSGKRAYLFDLDGTLVDSMWMWEAIDVEYLGRYGLECPSDLQKAIEGMSFSETAVYFKERFNLPDSIEEIKQAWVEMSLEKYQKEVPVKPGVREFLEEISIRGIKAGIATSNGREMVDAVLKSLGLEQYFQVVATACEVAAGKPAPDIYLEVARRLGAKPENCLVFEDVPAGIMAGKNAGMKVIAVEDDFSETMKEEKEQLADRLIHDFYEVL